MTAVEWLIEMWDKNQRLLSPKQIIDKAKEMEKVRTLLFAKEYDEYVFRGGSATMEEYYEETFKNQQDI